jgi:hypothetical protein
MPYMPYRIAGIDVHKKMLVVADTEAAWERYEAVQPTAP